MEHSIRNSNGSNAISSALLTSPVYGINLRADTLQGNLAPEGTMLVFLRHFGCMFCREMVADLRAQSVAEGEREGIVFFLPGHGSGGARILCRTLALRPGYRRSNPQVLPGIRRSQSVLGAGVFTGGLAERHENLGPRTSSGNRPAEHPADARVHVGSRRAHRVAPRLRACRGSSQFAGVTEFFSAGKHQRLGVASRTRERRRPRPVARATAARVA
jgi:hypothetical protein